MSDTYRYRMTRADGCGAVLTCNGIPSLADAVAMCRASLAEHSHGWKAYIYRGTDTERAPVDGYQNHRGEVIRMTVYR